MNHTEQNPSSHRRELWKLDGTPDKGEASTDDELINQQNADLTVDTPSPPDGIRRQPPFINHRRNDQPLSVIPAYYLRSVQGTASAKAAGDNDNVSNVHKPCNQIWLSAAHRCQAACLTPMPNLSDCNLKDGSFSGARGFPLLNDPLLFIATGTRSNRSFLTNITK